MNIYKNFTLEELIREREIYLKHIDITKNELEFIEKLILEKDK